MAVNINQKIDTKQTKFSKNLSRSLLWSDHHKVPTSVLITYQKDSKISRCLDIDDMTSPSQSGEVLTSIVIILQKFVNLACLEDAIFLSLCLQMDTNIW